MKVDFKFVPSKHKNTNILINELFKEYNLWSSLIWSNNISNEYVLNNLDKLNYTINNLDINLICEKPKVSKYRYKIIKKFRRFNI